MKKRVEISSDALKLIWETIQQHFDQTQIDMYYQLVTDAQKHFLQPGHGVELKRNGSLRVYNSDLFRQFVKDWIEHKESGQSMSPDIAYLDSIAGQPRWYRCLSCNNYFKIATDGSEIALCPICGGEQIEIMEQVP